MAVFVFSYSLCTPAMEYWHMNRLCGSRIPIGRTQHQHQEHNQLWQAGADHIVEKIWSCRYSIFVLILVDLFGIFGINMKWFMEAGQVQSMNISIPWGLHYLHCSPLWRWVRIISSGGSRLTVEPKVFICWGSQVADWFGLISVVVRLHATVKKVESKKWTVKVYHDQCSMETSHAPPTRHCRGD